MYGLQVGVREREKTTGRDHLHVPVQIPKGERTEQPYKLLEHHIKYISI